MPTPLDIISGARRSISVSSPAFDEGGLIPRKYTCEGEDVSPPLEIRGVPGEAAELALIMYDPDTPIGTFYHWLLYAMPPTTASLPEGAGRRGVGRIEYGVHGFNDFGRLGYGGPCPPRGHGRHRYYFLVVALSEKLGLGPGARPSMLLDAIRGRVLAYGYTYGVYERV